MNHLHLLDATRASSSLDNRRTLSPLLICRSPERKLASVQVNELLKTGSRSISQAGRMSTGMILGNRGLLPVVHRPTPLSEEDRKLKAFYSSPCISKILGKNNKEELLHKKRFEELEEELQHIDDVKDEDLHQTIAEEVHSPATHIFKVVTREIHHQNYFYSGNGYASQNPPMGHYDVNWSVVETPTSTPNIDWSKQVKKSSPKRIERRKITSLKRNALSMPNLQTHVHFKDEKHGHNFLPRLSKNHTVVAI
jgi:hypothetical protein